MQRQLAVVQEIVGNTALLESEGGIFMAHANGLKVHDIVTFQQNGTSRADDVQLAVLPEQDKQNGENFNSDLSPKRI